MDSLILGLRVLLSLAAVFGLMWLAYRRLGRGTAAVRAGSLNVVARQAVGAKASVVLVDTDGKRFLLGVTEHGITVLHTAEASEPEPVTVQAAPRVAIDLGPLPSEQTAQVLTRRSAIDLGPLSTAQPAELQTRRSVRRAAAFEAELRKQAARRNGRNSAVAGSVLDPATWRLAAGAIRTGRQP